MFPIRDDNPHFLKPWVTWGILGFNVLAWVLVQGMGADPSSIVPMVGASGGGVAFWAHIGGFAAGLILIPLLPAFKLAQISR